MTKCFYYNSNPAEFAEEVVNFFAHREDIQLSSWLRWSFKLMVIDVSIESISCVTANNTACFRIRYTDGLERPAGIEQVLCTTDLINGFLKRVQKSGK